MDMPRMVAPAAGWCAGPGVECGPGRERPGGGCGAIGGGAGAGVGGAAHRAVGAAAAVHPAAAQALGAEWPFYAVHPHGLIDPRIPASIEAMAADRLASLRALRPHRFGVRHQLPHERLDRARVRRHGQGQAAASDAFGRQARGAIRVDVGQRQLCPVGGQKAGKTAAQLAPILFFVLLLGGWAHRLIGRRDFSEETARD